MANLSALWPDEIIRGAWYDVEAVQINSALYGHYNYNTTTGIVKNKKSSPSERFGACLFRGGILELQTDRPADNDSMYTQLLHETLRG